MKEHEQDLPLFPVAGWEIGPVNTLPAVILRLSYVAGPGDDPANPNWGLRHVMNVARARELAAALSRAADRAEMNVG